MWTLVKNDFNDIELVRNDSYEGEVERIEMSNNEKFVKVNTYLGSKLLHVGKFDWKANDFAGQFKNNLGGRSSFLKKWKELDPASVSDGNLRINHTKRRFVSENTSKHESNPTPKNNSPATQKKDFKSRKEELAILPITTKATPITKTSTATTQSAITIVPKTLPIAMNNKSVHEGDQSKNSSGNVLIPAVVTSVVLVAASICTCIFCFKCLPILKRKRSERNKNEVGPTEIKT